MPMVSNRFNIVGSVMTGSTAGHSYPLLREFMEKRGYVLLENGNPDILISINHNERVYDSFIRHGGSPTRAFLIRFEPESVFPLQYRKSTIRKYIDVITPGSVADWALGKGFVGWPYTYNINPNTPVASDPPFGSVLAENTKSDLFSLENWLTRPIPVTMIAANKVSPLNAANYPVRRRIAKEMSPDILSVFGPLWNESLFTKLRHRVAVGGINLKQGVFPSPLGIYGGLFSKYQTAKGTVLDKHSVGRQTKFSLVVENSNTYVSEKLLDALVCGSIPIYVGPSLHDVGLPDDISIPSLGSTPDIMRILENTDEETVARILESIPVFLNSSLFSNLWTASPVYEKIADRISKILND